MNKDTLFLGAAIWPDSSDFPPCTNRGGKLFTPPTLEKDSMAITDWLSVSFPFPDLADSMDKFIAGWWEAFGSVFGQPVSNNKGMFGYTESYTFENGGVKFAFGGNNATAYLSLSGQACAMVPDWVKAREYLENVLQAKITRWDGAIDLFEGQFTLDQSLEWYLSGKFNHQHGRPSKMCQVGNWAIPDGKGRTLYLGSKKNGKQLCIYEKGKQLGDESSEWVRIELRLGDRDRVIPWDVLANPRKYVCGAYPCLEVFGNESCRVKTTTKTGQIAYNALLEHARKSYGHLIDYALKVEGSDQAVIELLRRKGVPKRLDIATLKPAMIKEKDWCPF